MGLWNRDGLRRNALHWLPAQGGFLCQFQFTRQPRPDIETTMIKRRDFPRTPDALAFAETAIKHIVAARISFGPPTFARLNVILTPHGERADIIVAFTGEPAFRERELQIHTMFVLRAVVVKTSPRPGGKEFVVHRSTVVAVREAPVKTNGGAKTFQSPPRGT